MSDEDTSKRGEELR